MIAMSAGGRRNEKRTLVCTSQRTFKMAQAEPHCESLSPAYARPCTEQNAKELPHAVNGLRADHLLHAFCPRQNYKVSPVGGCARIRRRAGAEAVGFCLSVKKRRLT